MRRGGTLWTHMSENIDAMLDVFCRRSVLSSIARLALQAIGGEAGSGPAATASDPQAAHTAKLRRTILFSLAHCCSKR